MAQDRNNTMRLGASQNVAVSGTSAPSAVVGANIYNLRLVSTTNCWIKVGAGTPVATTSSTYLPAGVVEYIHCGPGEKVAAIQDSASGTLNITEVTR